MKTILSCDLHSIPAENLAVLTDDKFKYTSSFHEYSNCVKNTLHLRIKQFTDQFRDICGYDNMMLSLNRTNACTDCMTDVNFLLRDKDFSHSLRSALSEGREFNYLPVGDNTVKKACLLLQGALSLYKEQTADCVDHLIDRCRRSRTRIITTAEMNADSITQTADKLMNTIAVHITPDVDSVIKRAEEKLHLKSADVTHFASSFCQLLIKDLTEFRKFGKKKTKRYSEITPGTALKDKSIAPVFQYINGKTIKNNLYRLNSTQPARYRDSSVCTDYIALLHSEDTPTSVPKTDVPAQKQVSAH